MPHGTFGGSIAERVARVAAIAAVHADTVDAEGRFPVEAIDAAKGERLLGAWIPTSFGGLGASLEDITEACAALGERCASTAMVFAMHQIQVACLVRHATGSPYLANYLRSVAASQRLIASGTSEIGVGGDVRTSKCAVEPINGQIELTKQAPVVSYGLEADDILATARRSGDASPNDQVMVLLERGRFALEQTSVWQSLGFRGTCSHGFVVRATVPHEAVFPVPYSAISSETMVPVSHLVWGSLWLGMATDAVRRARRFVREDARRQSGNLSAGNARLSTLVASLHAMRATVHEAVSMYATRMDDRDALGSLSFAIRINNVKLSASEALVDIAQQAMRVGGIYAYRLDTPVSLGRALRDAFGAVVMINNDRILAGNAVLLLASRED
jgi:acyl-CoA dehydrogenase